MIDTGSEINLIKESKVPKRMNIDCKNEFLIKGIEEEMIKSLGDVQFRLGEEYLNFSIITDDFPIAASGILGIDFCVAGQAKINYAD